MRYGVLMMLLVVGPAAMSCQDGESIESDAGAEGEGEGEGVTCRQVCEEASRCLLEEEPDDLCPGLWFRDQEWMASECRSQCRGDARLARELASVAGDCRAVRDTLTEAPELAGFCADGRPTPPPVSACETLSARIVECLVARCPAAAPVEAGLTALLTPACEWAAVGTPEMGEPQIDADTPCDDARVLDFGALLRAFGDGDLIPPLDPLCRDGQALPRETCSDACATTRACAPPGRVLATEAACLAACSPVSTSDGIAEVRCAAIADGCAALADCYTAP